MQDGFNWKTFPEIDIHKLYAYGLNITQVPFFGAQELGHTHKKVKAFV